MRGSGRCGARAGARPAQAPPRGPSAPEPSASPGCAPGTVRSPRGRRRPVSGRRQACAPGPRCGPGRGDGRSVLAGRGARAGGGPGRPRSPFRAVKPSPAGLLPRWWEAHRADAVRRGAERPPGAGPGVRPAGSRPQAPRAAGGRAPAPRRRGRGAVSGAGPAGGRGGALGQGPAGRPDGRRTLRLSFLVDAVPPVSEKARWRLTGFAVSICQMLRCPSARRGRRALPPHPWPAGGTAPLSGPVSIRAVLLVPDKGPWTVQLCGSADKH